MSGNSTLRAFEQIQGYLIESARSLFDTYGLEITHVQDGAPLPSTSGQCIAGVLGYTAEAMRGCVVIAASAEVFERAMPPRILDSYAQDDLLRDLAGEFANMLLAAVKGQLLHDGVELQVACPITAMCEALSLPSPSGGTSTWHSFFSASGTLYIRFDAQFDRDFGFSEPVPEAESALVGGEGGLF